MIKVNLYALIHAQTGAQKTITLNLGPTNIDDLELGYVKGALDFTRIDDGILVEGTLDTEAKTECTRCLQPFFVPIAIELEDTISLPGRDLTPERPVRVAEDGWADLKPLIREYAWIGLPVNAVCKEDCQGICPECGGNINLGECTCDNRPPIDPRWAALQALLEPSEEPQHP